MHDVLKSAWLWFDRLNRLLAVLAGTIMVLITLGIAWEILSRWFLGTGNLWLIEMSEYMLLYITMMGAAWVLGKDGHVSIDLITDRLGQAGRRRLQPVLSVLAALCCFSTAWFGVLVAADQQATGIRETTLMAPESYWITAVIPFGFLLLGIQFLRRAVRGARGQPLSIEQG